MQIFRPPLPSCQLARWRIYLVGLMGFDIIYSTMFVPLIFRAIFNLLTSDYKAIISLKYHAFVSLRSPTLQQRCWSRNINSYMFVKQKRLKWMNFVRIHRANFAPVKSFVVHAENTLCLNLFINCYLFLALQEG